MDSVRWTNYRENNPDKYLGVSVQPVPISSRYAVPKPAVPEEMSFAFPAVPTAEKKTESPLPKRPPNAVPVYTWRHKIDADTRPFGPLLFERMPPRYQLKKAKKGDEEPAAQPEKKKKGPMLTLSIDSNMQIDEKMIVAKLIQTKLFKTIRTMKKERAKAALRRAACKARATNRAYAAETAARQYHNMPPIVAQGRNCLARTLPLGRPRNPSQQAMPTYKWIIAKNRN